MAEFARIARIEPLPSVLQTASSRLAQKKASAGLAMSSDARTLARSLNDAAVAAGQSLVSDAELWSLLGSNAQEVLRALCAAGEAPAVSAGSSEPAASRARTASGLTRFPEDVLGAIIAFVDLPMRFTCVAACSTLRDACARLSPRLEHSLVAKRFPLLRTFSNIGTAPSELFRTFKNFEGSAFTPTARMPEATIHLDAYTLSLQLEIRDRDQLESGQLGPWRTLETLYVGAGTRSDDVYAAYEFAITPGLREQIEDAVDLSKLRASIVASRRIGGKLQFAKLWEGGHQGWGWVGDEIHFDKDELPFDRGNAALNFLKTRHDDTEMWEDPFVDLVWRPDVDDNADRPRDGPSIAEARIIWHRSEGHGEDEDTMPSRDAARCLEHYAVWSD